MEFRSKILSDRNNFFKGYNLNDVHDWYMDLAKRISDLSGIQSTAPKLLEYYLSPNNQKRNKSKKIMKYGFYIFYPLHMLMLLGIRKIIYG